MKNKKNSIISFGFLLVTIVSYILLYKINLFGSITLFDNFNLFISKITSQHWKYASMDILYWLWIGVPLVSSILSVTFGLKVFRSDEEKTAKIRIISI